MFQATQVSAPLSIAVSPPMKKDFDIQTLAVELQLYPMIDFRRLKNVVLGNLEILEELNCAFQEDMQHRLEKTRADTHARWHSSRRRTDSACD